MKKILFFGDSLTAGYGLQNPHLQSFPALLAQSAAKDGLAFEFLNAGVSGDTTQSAILRLPALLYANYDIIVVALGANDMLRGYPSETIKSHLEEMVKIINIKLPQSQILLLGMELPSWITAQRAVNYRNIYVQVAQQYHLQLLPFLLEGVIGLRNLNLPDLVHPNAEGYKVIANRVWPFLRSLLAATADESGDGES